MVKKSDIEQTELNGVDAYGWIVDRCFVPLRMDQEFPDPNNSAAFVPELETSLAGS